MKVMRADSLGMCFGVRDAVAMALSSPHRSDLTILGELVHNTEILRRLREAGVRSVPSVDAPVETSRVLITAHGAATTVIERLRARGLHVEEATCPLVTHAHRRLQRLVAQGYFPVVIGNPQHVEVRGLVGDLDEYAVISSEEDVPRLAGRPRLGVVSQTTQPLESRIFGHCRCGRESCPRCSSKRPESSGKRGSPERRVSTKQLVAA